jgi:hypothetical protein
VADEYCLHRLSTTELGGIIPGEIFMDEKQNKLLYKLNGSHIRTSIKQPWTEPYNPYK